MIDSSLDWSKGELTLQFSPNEPVDELVNRLMQVSAFAAVKEAQQEAFQIADDGDKGIGQPYSIRLLI